MSAYMVSRKHIDLLVAVAVAGPTGCRDWYPPSHKSKDDIGEMLVKENLSSIHHRYPDTITNPDDTPGPCEQYWLHRYTFRRAIRLTTIEALKAIDSYEYQACEHPEWETSEARKFCDALRRALVHVLPGWEQAPWGFDEEGVTQ